MYDAPESNSDFLQGLGLAGIVALIAIGVAIGTGNALFDEGADAVLTSRLVAAVDERKAYRPDQLTNPLPCDATVRVMVGPVVLSDQCYRRPR
jgi:hypothetical protein